MRDEHRSRGLSRPKISYFSSTRDTLSQGRLCKPQWMKFCRLMQQKFEISDKTGTSVIDLTLEGFLKRLKYMLEVNQIPISSKGIRLVGSAATSVISASVMVNEQEIPINDVDINIYIGSASFFQVLQCEEECLGSFITEKTGQELSPRTVCDNYFKEMIRVNTQEESWSLITIGNNHTNIDIRFIEKTKRSYAFSTDSFSIVLNPALCCPTLQRLTEDVVFESDYGDINEALVHLRNKKLKIKKPEEVRRGVFRACLELSKGRSFESKEEEERIRNTFCQAFFEEFQTVQSFEHALQKFLQKHAANIPLFLNHLFHFVAYYPNIEQEKKMNFCRSILDLTKQIQQLENSPFYSN